MHTSLPSTRDTSSPHLNATGVGLLCPTPPLGSSRLLSELEVELIIRLFLEDDRTQQMSRDSRVSPLVVLLRLLWSPCPNLRRFSLFRPRFFFKAIRSSQAAADDQPQRVENLRWVVQFIKRGVSETGMY